MFYMVGVVISILLFNAFPPPPKIIPGAKIVFDDEPEEADSAETDENAGDKLPADGVPDSDSDIGEAPDDLSDDTEAVEAIADDEEPAEPAEESLEDEDSYEGDLGEEEQAVDSLDEMPEEQE